MLELGVSGGRLFGLHLTHFPAARHCQQGTFFELNRLERFRGIGFTVGGRVGVENASKVGGRLGCGQHGERESPQLREQRQGWHDVGDAARLSRPIEPVPMQHAGGRHSVVFASETERPLSGMPPQDVILGRVAMAIEHHPINGPIAEAKQAGGRHLVRLNQPEIELDVGRQGRVGGENGKGLAIRGAGHAHRAELFRQADRLGPLHKCQLNAAVGFGVLRQHLQTGAGADHVVGQRQNDPASVAVVGNLVASPITQRATHLDAVRLVGGQAVGVAPVPAVVLRGDGRIVAGTQPRPRPGSGGPSRRA